MGNRYLGKTAADRGEKGLSEVSEVREIAEDIRRDATDGGKVTPYERKQAAARFNTLQVATQKDPDFDKREEIESVMHINENRAQVGLKTQGMYKVKGERRSRIFKQNRRI